MAYRKFQGDAIFTGAELLGPDQVLITDQDGRVEAIVAQAEAGGDIQKLDGWLSPGFINCHCHLELSHMKGLIPEHTGLVDFIISIVTQRHFPEEEILQAIEDAEASMHANGIVAVGDISNNDISFNQKSKHRLAYYTFLEISGWSPLIAEQRFSAGLGYFQKFDQLRNHRYQVSMAAHAPYSVSPELWQMINPYFQNKTTSLHNQETDFEDAFFLNKTGDFSRMYASMNINIDFFEPSGKSSLQTVARHLHGAEKTLLVHDAFTAEEDIRFIQQLSLEQQNHFYYCLCVNANQYISKALPPIDLFRKNACNMVVGTDSLASNHSLSIIEELKTISSHFPQVPLTEQLKWATANGAEALGFDQLGGFEKGKSPGVILIDSIKENALGPNSSATRLI